jgi:acetyl esterase/lipase
MLGALLFTWFATMAVLVVNALRRPVPPGKRFPPLWLPAMAIAEWAPWIIVANAGLLALLLVAAIDSSLATISLVFAVGNFIGLAVLVFRSLSAARAAGHEAGLLDLWPIRISVPEGVSVHEDVVYADGLTTKVYRRSDTERAPTLVYLHPGSWMRGRPGRQARPLLYGLAEKGWVILDISYPLSPAATFPDHLIGVKRAIAWAKTEGSSIGIDEERVMISGGSSGAHLAALAALTSEDTTLQPGFEEADTSVAACAPHYGIFDLLVRKATPAKAPELFRLGSPIDLVHSDAPPFLVVHGEHDSVVLPAESRHFVEALREAGAEAIYHEVPGGQHGFDAFGSLRSRAVGKLVADFLAEHAADVNRPGRRRDR